MLHEIIGWMAGDTAVHGTKIVDSTGFSISRYRDWHNAKYGTISVKQFAKLHIVHALGGMICSAAVTPGKANDSPYLREMLSGGHCNPLTCGPDAVRSRLNGQAMGNILPNIGRPA